VINALVLENRHITINDLAIGVEILFESCQSSLTQYLIVQQITASHVSADDRKLICINKCKDLQMKLQREPQFVLWAITGNETEHGINGKKAEDRLHMLG
jgi:hypothetical protein